MFSLLDSYHFLKPYQQTQQFGEHTWYQEYGKAVFDSRILLTTSYLNEADFVWTASFSQLSEREQINDQITWFFQLSFRKSVSHQFPWRFSCLSGKPRAVVGSRTWCQTFQPRISLAGVLILYCLSEKSEAVGVATAQYSGAWLLKITVEEKPWLCSFVLEINRVVYKIGYIFLKCKHAVLELQSFPSKPLKNLKRSTS